MKKLKLPKNRTLNLSINGHDYDIRFISGAKADFGSGDSEILGAISMRNCEIILEHSMKDSKILEVLCHEVMHAITYGTSLEMTETQVQVVANNLYQLGFGDYLWKKSGGNYDSKLRRNNKES
jgi:hypothetical protein|tara:strand:- start:421 stop:789 length:369 start_codon:yes stop_codon:yes gene_type:complete